MVMVSFRHTVVANKFLVLSAKIPKLHVIMDRTLKPGGVEVELCLLARNMLLLCFRGRVNLVLMVKFFDLLLLKIKELVHVLIQTLI